MELTAFVAAAYSLTLALRLHRRGLLSPTAWLRALRPPPLRAQAPLGISVDLSGRVALVTGLTSGIGLGLAIALARCGCAVALSGFGDTAESLALVRIAAGTCARPGEVFYFAADVAKAADAEALVRRVESHFGRCDVLVNNAGVQHVSAIDLFPTEQWDRIIAVNLSAPFFTMRAALPGMLASGFGRVINIASAHGLVASANKSAYVASKHGLIGLTKAAALEFATSAVTVNAVCPGWVLTPLVAAQVDTRAAAAAVSVEEDQAALLAEKQPSQRFSTPEEVGALCCFLASAAAANVRPSQLAAQLAGAISAASTHRTAIIELLNMADFSGQTESAVDVDKPLFAPLPPLVEFRHYEPFAQTQTRLSFRNLDRFPRRVRVVAPDSPFFSVSGPRNGRGQEIVDSRIAPGTEVHYTVLFSPRDIDDYAYELIVATEREKFLVPLRAVGKRGLLSFPDAVSFASTPVKSTAAKTFVVRNTGSRASEFRLSVPPPFVVSPLSGFVDVDQNLPVTLSFTPTEARAYSCDMVVAYTEGGYEAAVALSAAGHDVAVFTNVASAAFPGTYVTLSDNRRVTLRNDSELPVTFAWKACRDAEAERGAREQRVEQLEQEEEREIAAVLAQPDDDTLDLDGDGEDDLSESDDEDGPEASPTEAGGASAASPTHADGARRAMMRGPSFMAARAHAGGLGVSGVGSGGSSSTALGPDGTMTIGDGSGAKHARLSVGKRAQVVALRRKFHSLRKLALEEPLDFVSSVYSIQPAQGTLWARSEMEFSAVFAPNADADFHTFAWLDATGRSQRLPLELSGHGIGPKLTFTYDVVDVGNVCITSRHRYELRLMNKGSIDAHWSISAPDTPFGRRFHFEPATAFLRLGEEVAIDAFFSSDELGVFDEEFRLHMAGSKDYIKMQFLGRVVSPQFNFDIDDLRFGRVPFFFTQSRVFGLYNLSDVPFTYALHIPQDGKRLPLQGVAAKKAHHSKAAGLPQQLPPPVVEFVLTPSSGTIAAGGFHNIRMDFTPQTAKHFDDYKLCVDIEHVGAELLAVPISAESVVPVVDVAQPILSYGECFLWHKYEQSLVLRNATDLPARFVVEPQDAHTATVAAYTVHPREGDVPPLGKAEIVVRLVVKKHGPASVPIFVRVAGVAGEPLKAECQAKGRGPRVVTLPLTVDFGATPCLTPSVRELVVHNDSLVLAQVKLFMRDDVSRFSCDTAALALAPGEQRAVKITALLDDTVPHSDELCLSVHESEPLMVPVTARGAGSTMVSDADIATGVDFGQVFTTTTGNFSFTLENRGRRTQLLQWTNMTQRLKELARKKDNAQAKKVADKAGTAGVVAKPLAATSAVFSIEPTYVTVKPRGSATFTITCMHAQAMRVIEELECTSKADGDTKLATIFSVATSAVFVHPLLQFDKPQGLVFHHSHSAELDVAEGGSGAGSGGGLLPLVTQSAPLSMTNLSGLPLDFTLRTSPPFALDAYDVLLPAGQTAVVNVSFDPLYREDRTSHVAEMAIVATYRGHPRKDSVRLVADIHFPNVVLERRRIDFGTVLNDTSCSQVVRVTNSGKLPAALSWSFLENAEEAAAAAAAAGLPYVPVNQAFDILPIRCRLDPGQSQPVEFVFYGHPGRRFEAKAICEVGGGPDYDVDLTGEASVVSFRVDRSLIELGRTLWDKTEESDFTISNTGRVDYAFSIATDSASRPGVIVVMPQTGTVAAGDKQRVRIKVRPGVPGSLRETIVLSVAHFAPLDITIVADSVFGIISAALPRDPTAVPGFEEAIREATDTYIRAQREQEAAVELALAGGSSDASSSTLAEGGEHGLGEAGSIAPPLTVARTAFAGATRASGAGAGPDGASRMGSTARVGGGAAGAPGAPLPLVLPMAMEIEAEAARILFARHLLRFLSAERQVAAAERSAGILRRGGNRIGGLGLGEFGPGDSLEDGAGGEQSDGNGGAQEEKKGDDEGGARGARPPKGGRSTARSAGAVAAAGPSIVLAGGSSRGGEWTQVPAAVELARHALHSLVHPSRYVVAHYIIDLGNVVIGLRRTRSFSITNSGRTSASFAFDAMQLHGTGFELSPIKVQRLGECETMAFEVAYEAAPLSGSPDGIGLVRVDLLVPLAKGPAVVLSLRANVTVPDVRFSPDVLDFGSVLRGQERVVFFQIHNTSPVQVQWTVGNPIGSPPQVRDKVHFRFEPSDGTLQPGERSLARAAFAPGTETRPYGCTFPFKIQGNPKARQLVLHGRGDDVRIGFSLAVEQDPAALLESAVSSAAATAAAAVPAGEVAAGEAGPQSTLVRSPRAGAAAASASALGPAPLHIDIGPLVPIAEVGMRVITLTNLSAVAVELFSLDFDTQFRAEEALLALLGNPREAEAVLRLPFRGAGAPLAPELVAQARLLNAAAGLPLVPEMSPAATAAALAGPDAAKVAPSAAPAPANSARMRGAAVNIVVLGSGSPGFARALAQAFGAPTPALSLDGVILWARVGGGGAALRSEVNSALAASEAEIRDKDAAAAAALLAANPPAPAPTPAKGAKPAPAPAPVAAEPAIAPVPAPPSSPPQLSPELVARVLRARVERLDCGQAAVLESLACAALRGVAEGAAAVRAAMVRPGAGDFRIVSLPSAEAPEADADADEQAALLLDELPTSLHLVAARGVDDAALQAVVAALPPCPEEPNAFNTDLVLPAAETFALQRRPPPDAAAGRPGRPSPEVATRFRLHRAEDYVAAAAALSGEGARAFERLPTQPLRWVLQPGQAAHAVLRFNSVSVGQFTGQFGFGVVGVPREFGFTSRGTCAVPCISADPSLVFSNKVKQRAERALAQKKFVLARGVFEFGSLLAGRSRRDRTGYAPPPPPAEGAPEPDAAALALARREAGREKSYFELVRALHCERVRLTNTGPFPASITLSLSGPDVRADHARGTPFVSLSDKPAVEAKTGKGTPPADAAAIDNADSCFVVEPARIEALGVGKSADVSIWAFPADSGVKPGGSADGAMFMNTLVAAVDHSPDVVRFNLAVLGATPSAELRGPWEKFEGGKAPPAPPGLPALEAGVPLIDFERQLVESSEDRSFSVVNTGQAPLTWRINAAALRAQHEADTAALAAGSAAALPSISPFLFSPLQGFLAPGQSAVVTANFAASVELLRQHTLLVEFTDAECGFDYVDSTDDAKALAALRVAPPVAATKGKNATAANGGAAAPEFRSRLVSLPFAVRAESYRVVAGVRFEEHAAALATAVAKGGATAAAKGSGGKAGVDGGAGGGPGSYSGVTGGYAGASAGAAGPGMSTGHFDFGLLRVGQSESRFLPLSNTGKYPITFRAQLAKLAATFGEDLVTVTPEEGELQAGQDVKICLTFKAVSREVRLKDTKLLLLSVADAKSGKLVDQTLVTATAESTFSKFNFVPSKGLNFGALRYGQDKERKVEIKNHGAFPFTFNVALLGSPEDLRLLDVTEGHVAAVAAPPPAPAAAVVAATPAAKTGAGARPQTRAGSTPAVEAAAPEPDNKRAEEWGPFKLEPMTGTVPPGGTAFITARFHADGARVSRTSARIHISGFDFMSSTADTLCYEFVGESCVPGINATDWLGIFEEQGIVSSLDELASALPLSAAAAADRSPLGGEEKSEGSGSGGIDDAGAGAGLELAASPTLLFSRTRAGFSIGDRTFSFGTIIPTQHAHGVVERFRISNPTKIPALVSFAVKGDSEFVVSPSQAEIPIHESRYIEVRFSPSAIRKYAAVFTAEVEGGTLADTRRAEFSLAGEAALPSVIIVEPGAATRDTAEGTLLLDMGTCQAGHQSRSRVITVRNDSVFPAVVRFEMPASRVFRLVGGGNGTTDGLLDGSLAAVSTVRAGGGRQLALTLLPSQRTSIGVSFMPDLGAVLGASTEPAALAAGNTPGLYELDDAGAAIYVTDVALSVQHNPFEQERVRLRGHAASYDVTFDSTSAGGGGVASKDLISLAEVDVADSAGSVSTFTMRNGSERPIRFEWPQAGAAADPASDPAGAERARLLSFFSFSPRVGHLPAGATKTVTVRFAPGAVPRGQAPPSGPIALEKFAVLLLYQKVTYDSTFNVVALSAERRRLSEDGPQRPGSAASTGSRGSKGAAPAKGGAAPPAKGQASAPVAPGKGGKAPSRPTSAAGTRGPGAPPRARTRIGRRAVAPEPQLEWDSNVTALQVLPASSPHVQAALLAGTAVAVDSTTFRVPVPVPEPAYAVVFDGGLFIGEELPTISEGGPPASPSSPAAALPASPGGAPGAVKLVPVAEEAERALTQPLFVRAVADSMRYEVVGVSAVAGIQAAFKPTLMYQTRQHTFVVRNPAATELRFHWELGSFAGGARGERSPFSIEPAQGSIAPGASTTFAALFAPLDADDFSASATFVIEGLPAAQASAPGALLPLRVALSGRAQRPVAHMDLPASDYLGRRAPSLPGPNGELGALGEGIRVFEVPSLGVGTRNQKRFYIVNPTDAAYDFTIDPMGAATTSASCPLRCLTPRGMLLAGRRFEVAFEFAPLMQGTHEAFFRFSVGAHNLSQVLLVVGAVSEPRVALDRSSLHFRHLLTGARCSETVHLVNEEGVPFAFEFAQASFEAERHSIRIAPMAGVVPASGRLPIEVTFAPSEERFVNANISLLIKRKPMPLHLNVKGEGYDVHDRLMLQDELSVAASASAGAASQLAAAEISSSGVNFLDFGTVQVNERAAKRVVITNTGAFSFDFSWALAGEFGGTGAAGARALASTLRAARGQGLGSPGRAGGGVEGRPVRVSPEAGKVAKGGQVVCELEFRPTAQMAIAGMVLVCTVANVKKYQVSVSAVGGKPSLEFSTLDVPFGDCILPPSLLVGAVSVTRTIRITNREADRDVSLQCTFEKRPHLDVGLDAAVLRPGDAIDVPITFTPRQALSYAETVPFEVNGLHTVNVAASGEGVPCAIELVNPSQCEVSFGALRPSQSSLRVVKIASKCRRALVLDVLDEDGAVLASTASSGISSGNGGAGSELARLKKKYVTAAATRLLVRGKDSAQIELSFSPPSRVPAFREQLYVRVAAAGAGGAPYGAFSERVPLLSLSGACLGMDVMLELDTLSFGAVCEGSKLTKTVNIYNGGDVPTQFRFDTAKLGRNFSIAPTHGFLSPQSEATLSVTFAPTRVGRDIRAEAVRCDLEGAPDPLFLVLTGDCVARPSPTGAALQFACKARDAVVQTLTLPPNPTDRAWVIVPVIGNDFWSGPATVEVPPKGTATYALTYRPLLMTVEGGPTEAPPALPGSAGAADPTLLQVGLSVHTGSVFFPLPDGTGALFALSGKADKPAPGASVTARAQSKKTLHFAVPVTNWMRSTQRFTASWDASKLPATAVLKGARTLDVPGLGTRDYKLSFLAAVEGKYSVPLTFTNEATGEFLSLVLELDSTAAGVQDVLRFEASVRQTVSQTVSVANPLAAAGTPITWSPWPPVCTHPAVRVTRLGEMRGAAEGLFRVDFRPFVATKRPTARDAAAAASPVAGALPPPPEVAKLTLHSDQLGDFVFDLELLALGAGVEPGLAFSAPLGAKQAATFRFRAFDVKPGASASYKCVAEPATLFSVPPSLTVAGPPAGAEAWDGVDASVDVTFEGTALSGEGPSAVPLAGTLMVTSDATGSSWTVPMSAFCLPPRPAGPFGLAPGGTTSIDFRNVFNEDLEFIVSTDQPGIFAVTPAGALRMAKKSNTALTVAYSAPLDGSAPRGKLVVACPSIRGEPTWLFYLEGRVASKGEPVQATARGASAGKKGAK